MNDIAATSQYVAERVGGVAHLEIDDLNGFLQRTPFNRGGYISPIDAARHR